MSPRLGFALSLFAACGIHAILLLVPRSAFVETAHLPTVELELTAVGLSPSNSAEHRGGARPTPVVTQPTPVVTQPATTPSAPLVEAPQQFAAQPPAPAEQSGTESAAAPPGGQADAPVLDRPTSEARSSTDAGGDSGASVPERAGAQASTGLVSRPALGTPPVSVPVFIPPTTRSAILPMYPRSARRSGLEGVVRVTALVDESGTVTSVEVLSSSGHGALDQAALEAVRRAAFTPALQDGKPVVCRIVIPVRFTLTAKQN